MPPLSRQTHLSVTTIFAKRMAARGCKKSGRLIPLNNRNQRMHWLTNLSQYTSTPPSSPAQVYLCLPERRINTTRISNTHNPFFFLGHKALIFTPLQSATHFNIWRHLARMDSRSVLSLFLSCCWVTLDTVGGTGPAVVHHWARSITHQLGTTARKPTVGVHEGFDQNQRVVQLPTGRGAVLR
jgi:hypothetical protein